ARPGGRLSLQISYWPYVLDTRDGDRESGAYRVLGRYRQRRGGKVCQKQGTETLPTHLNTPACRSGDAFGAYAVIAGNCARTLGGRISEQGGRNARPLRVAVNMREQRFYSRHQGLAVE